MCNSTHTPVTGTFGHFEGQREERTYCSTCGDLLAVAYVMEVPAFV